MYGEISNDVVGYTYVDYDTYSKGEYLIREILDDMPSNLNNIEK